MILNEFLQIKLGVTFENKYNALAVEEVLANKEKYPKIAEDIVNAVEYAEDTGKFWDFESGFFDCDDNEFCAGYAETLELYRAFVNAFSKEINDKLFDLKYVSFGLDYLMYPNTSSILDPYFHYLGMNQVIVYLPGTDLFRKIYYPFDSKEDYLGMKSSEEYIRKFVTDNEMLLKKIAEELKVIFEDGSILENRFENEDLAKHSVELENGKIGYSCDCYEICIGENVLRFFSTDRETDSFSKLRSLILESLDDKQRENKIVKTLLATK